MATVSQPRQNYHEECEMAINQQINIELYASYVFLSMAYYFDRDDVALKGFHEYFRKASDWEQKQAERLMGFQNQRGGRIVLRNIQKPDRDEWGNGMDAMSTALAILKTFNELLLALHKMADRHGDAQMCDFLESSYLTEQVEAIKDLADHVTNLKTVSAGLGEYIYSQNLSF